MESQVTMITHTPTGRSIVLTLVLALACQTSVSGLDSEMNEIVDWYDQCIDEIAFGDGTLTDVQYDDPLASSSDRPPSRKMVRFLSGELSLYKKRQKSDPADEDASHVIMVNDQYAAAIMREPKHRRWTLRVLTFKGETQYEQMREQGSRLHPVAGYLGGTRKKLRRGTVTSREATKFDGINANRWTVDTSTSAATGNPYELTLHLVIEAERPYRIFSIGQSGVGSTPDVISKETRWSEWTNEGDATYPRVADLYYRKNTDTQLKFVTSNVRTLSENLNGFEPEMAYLSYYGLDEPGEKPTSPLWYVLLTAVIGSVFLFVGSWLHRRSQAA